MAHNIMGMGNAGTSTAGKSFLSTLIARMPYTYKVIQNAINANPKYDTFNAVSARRDQRLRKQSILQNNEFSIGEFMLDKRYHQVMYADIDTDKIRRIQEYRRMADYSELADCIDEIADESIVKDDEDDVVKFYLRGDFDRDIENLLKKEWKRFTNAFDLENKGWEMVRQFLIEGELFYENIVSKNRPEYGIIGIAPIPSELINPCYDNVQNQIINSFILRKPVVNPKAMINVQQQEELIVLDKNQVTYVHSGLWNEDRTIRLPYIERSRKAYKQLSLIEDAIIIHRLVRAPERLVFKVDVGNLPVPKAEEYLKKLMQEYWAKKNFDVSTGDINNVYAPQSYTDCYWFTKRGDSQGTTVEPLQHSSNFSNLDDLMYFVKKLYKTLKVPVQRLDPADPFKDGTEVTREELRFSRFIIRIQQQIARGLKESFVTHLKLREKDPNDEEDSGLWGQYKLSENNIHVEFNTPTSFGIMREQQIFNLKKENFSGLAATDLLSTSFCQKYYLGLDERQMAENREWLRKDAELTWELQHITVDGPNFREKLVAEEEAQAELSAAAAGGGGMGGMAGSALPEPGGEFTPDMPPDFGPMPEGGAPAAGEGEAAAAETPEAPPS
jgi:hypothetical protein